MKEKILNFCPKVYDYVTESGNQLLATLKPIKRKGKFAFVWRLATRAGGWGWWVPV